MIKAVLTLSFLISSVISFSQPGYTIEQKKQAFGARNL